MLLFISIKLFVANKKGDDNNSTKIVIVIISTLDLNLRVYFWVCARIDHATYDLLDEITSLLQALKYGTITARQANIVVHFLSDTMIRLSKMESQERN